MKRVKKDKKDEEDTIISQMNALTKKYNMTDKWAFSFLTKLLRQFRASGG